MNTWELYVYLMAAGLAAMPVVLRARRHGGSWWVLVAGIGVVCLAGAMFAPQPQPTDEKPDYLFPNAGQKAAAFIPRVISNEGFRSSDACQSCHPGNYASWHKTFHRTMTQVASPESVLGSFDDVLLEDRGLKFRLYREGDEFWAEMPDPDEERRLADRGLDIMAPEIRKGIGTVNRRIVMTTGSHSFQGYWVPATRGLELLQFPWVYVIHEDRWLPYDDVFLRPPEARRRIAVWNSNCIQCHALDGNPKGVGQLGELFSEVAELGISCEACHGPGEEHIRKHRNPITRYRQRMTQQDDDTITNPAKCSTEISAQICGACHSAFQANDVDEWWEHGYSYRAGEPLEQSRHMFSHGDKVMEAINAEVAVTAFWNDGTMRVGGREYVAMVQSSCYLHNDESQRMTCLSCHSMHHYDDPSDQLKPSTKGNQACLQCHESYAKNLEQHTHHPADSAGSLCYNCHMPYTSYALMKAIRSHRVDSPNLAASVDGRPNGCNQCHLDKSLGWTASHMSEWYGIDPPVMSDEEANVSASLLLLLKGDATQRAITSWTMGWDDAQEISGNEWQAPFLAPILDDPYSAVRFMAFDALRSLPGFEDIDYDFVGSKRHRQQTVIQVDSQWSKRPKQLPKDLAALLLDDNGKVRRSSVSELLKQRDDRPVEFPE